MATVKEHYEDVLSDVYSWMFGGFESGLQRNTQFLEKHAISPKGSGVAIDLGAGCGFQSIPLAKAGYRVTAIDTDKKLLDQLQRHAEGLSIKPVQDDLLNFNSLISADVELIVCMTDTLVHLASKQHVKSLFDKALSSLENGGKFIVTLRDLTFELEGLDRFLPVRSDKNIIFTCFLEYEKETVKVHDILYKKQGSEWQLKKSFYRKLRLNKEWVVNQLSMSGFSAIYSEIENGFITVIATK